MEDITPKLLEKIQDDFQKSFEKSKKIKSMYARIRDGTATYKEANEFAIETGEILASVFRKNISSSVLPDGIMYYNISERILGAMLGNNYKIVADASSQVQNILNKAAGIGIKAIKPEINQDRINGIVNVISGRKYEDIAYMLQEPVINFTQSVVDDTVRTNADFQHRSGLSPKIIRTSSGGCCNWCEKIAGTYDYESVSDTGNDVFRRHQNCRCTVEYIGNGIKQDVHTKQWSWEKKSDKIEIRKSVGLKKQDIETPAEKEKRIQNENGMGFADRIASHPKMLGAFTPKGLKASLENAGYEVKTLSRGNYKDIAFEDGGGFKVNFGGDGILQYHPEKGSHHGGAYYKISTGKGGTKHYGLDGTEKAD